MHHSVAYAQLDFAIFRTCWKWGWSNIHPDTSSLGTESPRKIAKRRTCAPHLRFSFLALFASVFAQFNGFLKMSWFRYIPSATTYNKYLSFLFNVILYTLSLRIWMSYQIYHAKTTIFSGHSGYCFSPSAWQTNASSTSAFLKMPLKFTRRTWRIPCSKTDSFPINVIFQCILMKPMQTSAPP